MDSTFTSHIPQMIAPRRKPTSIESPRSHNPTAALASNYSSSRGQLPFQVIALLYYNMCIICFRQLIVAQKMHKSFPVIYYLFISLVRLRFLLLRTVQVLICEVYPWITACAVWHPFCIPSLSGILVHRLYWLSFQNTLWSNIISRAWICSTQSLSSG